jgi:hypothetical protein
MFEIVVSSNDMTCSFSIVLAIHLPVKHKKGFTGHKMPAKPFAIRFYSPGIPARLLTFGIEPVCSCLPAIAVAV